MTPCRDCGDDLRRPEGRAVFGINECCCFQAICIQCCMETDDEPAATAAGEEGERDDD